MRPGAAAPTEAGRGESGEETTYHVRRSLEQQRSSAAAQQAVRPGCKYNGRAVWVTGFGGGCQTTDEGA